MVEDTSTNGTIVNNHRLKRGERSPLAPGESSIAVPTARQLTWCCLNYSRSGFIVAGLALMSSVASAGRPAA